MAKKQIQALNQTADRIVQLLDNIDAAISVKDADGNVTGREGKYWVTGQDSDGNDVILSTKLSEDVEFTELGTKISAAETTVSNIKDSVNANSSDIDDINKRLGEIEANMDMIASKITITRISAANLSVLFSNPGVIEYNVISEDSTGAQTGKITVTWRKGGSTGQILKTETIDQGNNRFALKGYLTAGDNTITAIFTDNLGTSRTINWLVNAIDLQLIPDFSDADVFPGAAIISYEARGSVDKVVHFLVDGEEVYSNTVPAGNNNSWSYTLAHRNHGTYALTIYMTATVGETEVFSDKWYYDVMFIDEGNTTTLIRWPYDESVALEQYKPQTFKYSVYTPNSNTSDIQLLVNDEVIANRTIDTKEQEWFYRPETYTEEGQTIKLSIKCGSVEKVKNIEITKFPYDISQVTGNLELDFNPTGRTNNDNNYNIFNYTGVNGITTNMEVSNGFDWNNGGWQTDRDGNTYFCVKAGDRMYLDYPLFKDGRDPKIYGKNIKFIFKATNCRDFKASVARCLEEKGTYYLFQTTTTTYDLENTNEVVEEPIIIEYRKITAEDGTESYENTADPKDVLTKLPEGTLEQKDSFGHITKRTTTTAEKKAEEIDIYVVTTIVTNIYYPIETTITSKSYVNGVNPDDSSDIIDTSTITPGVTITEEKDENDAVVKTITLEITSDNSYVGIDIQAQDAVLYCQTGKVEAVYCEDKTIALEFNVEENGTLANTMTAYTNADPIKIELYDGGTASFVHTKERRIEFGSDDCDVYIYRFKVYSSMLSDDGIMSNFIADAFNSDEMVSRYERNAILKQDGKTLDYEKLSQLYPDLRIILIECDRFTNDKDDKVKGCTVQQIMGNGDKKHNWTSENVQIKGQGTSSNEYGTSARNIDLKFNKYEVEVPVLDEEGKPTGTTETKEISFSFADGSYDTVYSMTDNSIGVNYINIKVNVASSENANNSRLAQRFHQYNPYIRPARVSNSKVRDTMEFHPCVIFLKETGDNPQEFPADGEYHFYAYGDFGNSKKNHDAFGMDKDNLAECIVEISNNTFETCRFKKPESWEEVLPVGFNTETNTLTEYVDYWDGDAIEFRYPEDLYAACVYTPMGNDDDEFSQEEVDDARARLAILQPNVQRLWNWVYSTDTTAATNEALPETVNYAGVNYTIDNEEYRRAKFINEYQNYFIKDSLLFHYLFTDRYLMIDNRAKNVFIHTSDGIHWDFCFNYDDDTALGCDNRGDLKFDYYYEDIDQINGLNVYNAQDSVLWNNVRSCLAKELRITYDNSAECWSMNNLLNDFNAYQSMKCERLELIDMRRKYIRPYKEGHYRTNLKADPSGETIISQGQYLTMLNGKKILQRERFEKYRSIYTDSKYQATAIKEDLMTWRANSPEYANPNAENHISVTWGDYFEITPYCNMYLYLDFDTNLTEPIRSYAGQSTKIYKLADLSDTNTRIYGASMISSLGDLAPFFIEAPDFAKGTKLSTLKIGDQSADYVANSELTSLKIGSNKMLEVLDLRGCQDLKIGLDLSGCTGLKELYTERSGITGVTFADGGLIETAKLNAIGALKAHNLKNLKEFSMTNYLSLTSLNVENTTMLTALDFIKQCSKVNTLRLIGIDWDLTLTENSSILDNFLNNEKYDGIDVNDATIDYPVISGNAEFSILRQAQLKQYNEIWPTLNVTYDTLIPSRLVRWVNYDGEELYREYIDGDGYTPTEDPVVRGLIEEPQRPKDAQYEYKFIKWSPEVGFPVFDDETIFTAQYDKTEREYTVTWKVTRNGEETKTSMTAKYGSSVTLDVSPFNLSPYYHDLYKQYYVFSGWDADTSYITEDLIVNAKWISGQIPVRQDTNEMMSEPDTWNAANWYGLCQKYSATELVNIVPAGNRATIKHEIPEYNNKTNYVDLISEPKYFDGSTVFIPKNGEGATYNLLETDRDWTLLIDYKALNTGAIVSCMSTQSSSGLLVAGTETTGGAIQWNGSSASATNERAISSWSRNVVVISHKKGEPQVYVTIGAPWNTTQTNKTLGINNTITTIKDRPLVLGAQPTITSFKNYLIGYIYKCRLYYDVFGENGRKELTTWYYSDMKFDITSYDGVYSLDGTETNLNKINFMSANALPFLSAMYTGQTPEYITNSGLYQWLENRFYRSLPVDWQVLLATPQVRHAYSNNGIQLINTPDLKQQHIWLPSFKEMSNTNALPYINEYQGNTIYTTSLGQCKPIGAYIGTSDVIIDVNDLNTYLTGDSTPTTRLDGTALQNGDVWYDTKYYHVYRDLEWHIAYDTQHSGSNTSYTIWLRGHNSGVSTSSFQVLYSSNSVASFSGTYTRAIVPCFSI